MDVNFAIFSVLENVTGTVTNLVAVLFRAVLDVAKSFFNYLN